MAKGIKKLNGNTLSKKVFKNLIKIDKLGFLEQYAVFMGKTQLVELEMKGLLIRKYGYNEDKIIKFTLGRTIIELKKSGLRKDFVKLLEGLLDYRNDLAHEFLGITAYLESIRKGAGRLQHKQLRYALFAVEEIIIVYDFFSKNGYF